MRRLKLALALLGAVAAAGCGGAGNNAGSAGSGGSKGVATGDFTVTVQNGQNSPEGRTDLKIKGGRVYSTPAGINCGVRLDAAGAVVALEACSANFPLGTDVILDAEVIASTDPGYPTESLAYRFLGWAGDCTGELRCTLSGNADKYVVASFGGKRLTHGNFSDAAVHGPAYFAFAQNVAGALDCKSCHGANLKGVGLAVSCWGCHSHSLAHFDVEGAAWESHGTPGTGWSAACQRCHTGEGFRDYVGADNSAANNALGSFLTERPQNTDAGVGAYAFGPLKCGTCHQTNDGAVLAAAENVVAIGQVYFPSFRNVAAPRSAAVCGQCHQGRESTLSVNAKIASSVSSKGLGATSVSALTTGSGVFPTLTDAGAMTGAPTAGSGGTLVGPVVSATRGVNANLYVGYTAIFTGNVTAALNGFQAIVTGNSSAAAGSGLSPTYYFDRALPAAPANTVLPLSTNVAANLTSYPVATAGTNATTLFDSTQNWTPSPSAGKDQVGKTVYFASGACAGEYAAITANTATSITFAAPTCTGGGAPAVADRYLIGSRTSDTVVMYPTATAWTDPASLTTLADANRTWTANQWANFYVYFQTGANAGLYSKISANTATTLTFAAVNAPVAAGTLYQIVPPQTNAVLDAQFASSVSFLNPHYLGAAATVNGADAAMWFEYPGRVYTRTNAHAGQNACTSCHNPHTGSIVVTRDTCGKCHFDETTGMPVDNFFQLEESRQYGFEGDIDGDGFQRSLKLEIDGLAAKLLAGIKIYAANVVPATPGQPQYICYNADAHPYWFHDNDNDGVCSAAESKSSNGYAKFTPRLLRAAFNYKWSQAEPGAWAHNPRYAIEVLYDAILDLNVGISGDVTAPIGTAIPVGNSTDGLAISRSFLGHFGSAGFKVEPYAQFLYHPAAGSPYGTPGPGFSSRTCYQCHGGQGGFEKYLSAAPLTTNLTVADKVTGMQCTTCHNQTVAGDDFKALRSVPTLFVPPQKDPAATPSAGQVSFAAASLPPSFALCATCHTGLENKASVDNKIAAAADPNSFGLGFVNGHYFGAAGVILGNTAHVLYEYPGQTYAGLPPNWSVTANGPHGSPHGARCAGCHSPQNSKHSFEIDEERTVVIGTYHDAANTQACNGCHVVTPYGDFRLAPKKENLRRLAASLLAEIQNYAWNARANGSNNVAGANMGICYNGAVYPYFIRHAAATGDCTTAEVTNNLAATPKYEVRVEGAYTFNAQLLRAAYNYQWYVKEPGAAEHNYEYMAQALIDSIQDLNPAAVLPMDASFDPGNNTTPIVRP